MDYGEDAAANATYAETAEADPTYAARGVVEHATATMEGQ